MSSAQRPVKKLLLVGLDNSGKTTMIKRFKKDVVKDQKEMIMTTPFLNVEKVTLPFSQNECLVYDMSGQVSARHAFVKNNIQLLRANYSSCHFYCRVVTAKVGVSFIRMWTEFSLLWTPVISKDYPQHKRFFKKWRNIPVSIVEIRFPLSFCRTRWTYQKKTQQMNFSFASCYRSNV